MSNADKMLEESVGDLVSALGIFLKEIFLSLIRGIKALKTQKNLIIFMISVAIAFNGRYVKEYGDLYDFPAYVQISLYYLIRLFPLITLVIIGYISGREQRRSKKIFKEIEFKSKDGKYPYLCGVNHDNKKVIYIFKSNIPLTEWRSKQSFIETGFDCNIVKIQHGKSKKTVRVVTIPSDCEIPLRINWSDEYLKHKSGTIVVGVGAVDQIEFDLDKVPHVLIAGETGSGKSVILRTCLWQMINQASRIFMIDFKGGVEFGKRYEQYGEVITERKRALKVLDELVKENAARLKLFRELEVKNLGEYNRKYKKNLCRIGVFCDEIAEMLDKKGVAKEEREVFEQIEGRISTLARLSRATGINLFLGVQRPDANVLTGQIKNNIPVRISGRFADKSASEIVLGNTAAVDLPDIKGRFLYKVGNETIEFQSYYFDDDTMLKKVDVEVGDMLTQKSKSGKSKVHTFPERKAKKTEKVVDYTKKAKKEAVVLEPLGEISNIKDINDQLAAMDEYDLNNLF